LFAALRAPSSVGPAVGFSWQPDVRSASASVVIATMNDDTERMLIPLPRARGDLEERYRRRLRTIRGEQFDVEKPPPNQITCAGRARRRECDPSCCRAGAILVSSHYLSSLDGDRVNYHRSGFPGDRRHQDCPFGGVPRAPDAIRQWLVPDAPTARPPCRVSSCRPRCAARGRPR
jgi:hypothetical protein